MTVTEIVAKAMKDALVEDDEVYFRDDGDRNIPVAKARAATRRMRRAQELQEGLHGNL